MFDVLLIYRLPERVREDEFCSPGLWRLRQVFKSMGNYLETSEVGL